jgi:hypothetical protein
MSQWGGRAIKRREGRFLVSSRSMFERLTSPFAARWASASLVFAVSCLTGHYASLGMTPAQWLGAAVAVLGSVSVAVAVRLQPEEAGAGD